MVQRRGEPGIAAAARIVTSGVWGRPDMKHRWLWASLAGAVVAVGGVVAFLSSGTPAGAARGDEPAAGERAQLPIGQVVLFSSGVGYYQREGSVEGDARVDLSFPVTDINDLIKSMVLRDLDGGHITAVSYDSNAPIDRTLKSFAINLTTNPSYGQVLNQARGEKVEVTLQQAAAGQPGSLSGTIVGVEHQKQTVGGKDTVEVEQLNLWCSDGLRSVKLADVQRVRFLNPVMESEIRKALETLALSHDTQKKAVSISFKGEGKRQVRVGYVIESPIWKTSYRLVLAKAKDEKPFLQGWSVVENTTDEDWKDIRMALVSGRPISFQMDLYQPLFVQRPVVEPELFASLRPVAYSGGLNGRSGLALGNKPAAPERLLERGERKAGARQMEQLKKLDKAFDDGDGTYAGRVEKQLQESLQLGASGVASAATASKLGDFFQYAIDRPVSLARQKSALLPIVNKDVEGTRVSIYNERTQAKFPLLGLKFKNTSGLHLMQGPITVFEGSNYAGDARILDLQPNEERLISYAVDLGTEVNPVPATDNGRITEVKAVKGILYTRTRLRESKTYTIKNRNEQDRLVLVEHPVRNDFHLTDKVKPSETASDFYRFEIKVAPGKAEELVVSEEKDFGETVVLTNLNDDQVRHFISQPVTSSKVKAGLQRTMELRWEVAKTQREIAEQERQLQVIVQDQTRLRANLKELPSDSPIAKRIVEKFGQQETQVEKYQADIKKLQGQEHSQRKAMEDYLAAFSAE
jgi:hypothetical protein